MVFENLTLFELNLEGAQIGPEAIGMDADDGVAVEPETGDESGGMGRVLFLVGVSLVVSIAAAVAARRFFGSDDDGDGGIEIAESGSGIESAAEN